MKILQVNTCDLEGGAAKVAWNLMHGYRAAGNDAWFAVGRKISEDHGTFTIHAHRWRYLFKLFRSSLDSLLKTDSGRVKLACLLMSHAGPYVRRFRKKGSEDFDYPLSWHLLDMAPEKPDIVHLHNLHGSYFDLRALPWLSSQVPVVLTLHDAWPLSGHCAHSLDCERWKHGCGACPDLTLPPAVERDDTAYNWRRKSRIFRKSDIRVATPCRWLMEKVNGSMLEAAVLDKKIIPNGVDLSVFHAGNQEKARHALQLPQKAAVILGIIKGNRKNPWQDYRTMEEAVLRAAKALPGRTLRVVLVGRESVSVKKENIQWDFVPYQKDPASLALMYQAADLFIHASKADTFPTTVLEALACGVPVITTPVGGIVEQVKGLKTGIPSLESHNRNTQDNGANGLFVHPGGRDAMATAITYLMEHPSVRHRLSENAVCDAQTRFDVRKQVQAYLTWFNEILGTEHETGN